MINDRLEDAVEALEEVVRDALDATDRRRPGDPAPARINGPNFDGGTP